MQDNPRWESHSLAFAERQMHSYDHPKRTIWSEDGFDRILYYITLLSPIWVSNAKIFSKRDGCKSIICKLANEKSWLPICTDAHMFFLKMCNMKKYAPYKVKINMPSQVLIFFSLSSLPAIIVQQTLLQVWCSPDCKYHFFFYFFIFSEGRALRRRLQLDSGDPCL